MLLLLAIVIAFLLRTVVAQAFFIPSPSMGCDTCPVHTLEVDDKIVVSKLAYRLHPPRRGDVVVFDAPPAARTPAEPQPSAVRVLRRIGEAVGVVPPSTEEFVKRVIALPGETVEARGGQVFVNGRPLIEPYLPPGLTTADFPPALLGPDEYWVMGDNRANSRDSRFFGAVPRDTMVGRAVLRVWPPGRAAFL